MAFSFTSCFKIALIVLNLSLFANVDPSDELPQIVAFLGSKRVGKDTSADYLIRSYGYEKYALADPMKQAVQSLFHFSEDQLWGDAKEIVDPYWEVTPREIMQFIGIDTLFEGLATRFPHLGHTFYLRAFDRWRDAHPQSLVVISDLRMQEDVFALKKRGALIIRIKRPEILLEDTHVSEAQVASVTGYDITIVNDGTIEELEEKIKKAIKNLCMKTLTATP